MVYLLGMDMANLLLNERVNRLLLGHWMGIRAIEERQR